LLILTRKLGESIKIGDDVKVTLLDIKGRQVRLGIEAPIETEVHREEIYQQIKEENILAARYESKDLEEMTTIWKGRMLGRKKN